MNDLELYFKNNRKNQIHKWSNYFNIYERYLSKFRGKNIIFLEIGVSQGGSLQMWQHYFGDGAKIYGIDIDPRCRGVEEKNIKVFTGSQKDPKFLREVIKKIAPIDIVIDDGSHNSSHQIMSFKELFGALGEGGIYLCEDTFTSYWLKYGGGYKRRGTYIEHMKNIVDDLHAYHSRQKRFKVTEYTKSISFISFYNGIVVVEKGNQALPRELKSGDLMLLDGPRQYGSKIKKIRFIALYAINYILRALRFPPFIWK